MARNGAGTYSLPAGQPVVTGTTISAATFNTLTSDLSTELTDSLSRSGKGGMTAALLSADGAVGAPQYSFTSDTDTGTYRIGANDWAVACGGVKQFELTTAACTIVQPIAAATFSSTIAATGKITAKAGAGALIVTAGGQNSITFRNQGDSADKFVIGRSLGSADGQDFFIYDSVATAARLTIASNGDISTVTNRITWTSGPSATGSSPGPSAVTAISPDVNITNTITAGYWKDPMGIVHLKGFLTNATGGNTLNFVTTTPLPAGFRPAAQRTFTSNSDSSNIVPIHVNTDGTIKTPINVANGSGVTLDVISFLAEA